MPFKQAAFKLTDDGWPLVLTAPLVYTDPKTDKTYRVPTGFTTDLASIPRPLWALFPPFGLYSRAAILHDYQYHLGRKGLPGPSRKEADLLFKQVMHELGVPGWKRWMFYLAVRAANIGAGW